MIPVSFDHLLFFIVAVVLPLLAVKDLRDLRLGLAAGRDGARIRAYRQGLWHEWLPTLALLVGWTTLGRTPAALGLGAPRSWEHWTVLVAGVLLSVVGWLQVRAARSDPEALERFRGQLRPLEAFLPRTRQEARWFGALGVSAGVCEELLYRGFLVAYLASYLGLWPGAVAAGVIFGLAHVYQGSAGILRTGAFGIVLALVYAWSGQLWGLMVFHAAVDVLNGGLARTVLTRDPSPAPPEG